MEREGGKLPDKDGLENTYGMLRSTRSVRDEVRVFLTEGNGFVTDNFYYQLTKPLGSALSLEAAVKAGEGETERTLLPEANYDFPDGKKLDIAGDAQHSALKRIRFFAENLAPGEYYLPLTVAADAADAADAERQILSITCLRSAVSRWVSTNSIRNRCSRYFTSIPLCINPCS